MDTDNSSVAVKTPPQSGAQLEENHNAIIKAFDALYDQTPVTEVKVDDNLPDDTGGTQNNENDPEDGEGLEEDDEFLLPRSQHYAPGTTEDFTEKMRFNGLRWRHALRKRVQNDPQLRELLQWVNNRPSSMDEATRPLGKCSRISKPFVARQAKSST